MVSLAITHRHPDVAGPEGKRTARSAPLTTSRDELLVDESDSQFRQLVHDLFALSARHEKIRSNHAKAIGLRGAQYTVLIAIAHLDEGGGVLTREVADHLRVTPTFVTMETSKLALAGLIDKPRSRTDERAAQLSVTVAGLDLLDELAPLQRKCNDEEFASLTTEEFRELHRLVRLLITNGDRTLKLQAFLTSNHDRLEP